MGPSFSKSSGPGLRSSVNRRRPASRPIPKLAISSIQDLSLSGNFFPTTTATPTTTNACIETDCKIELFSRTLFRGTNVTLTTGSKDLADFDNKVESLRVSGNCQWKVYTEKDHAGVEQSFTIGDFKNAKSVRNILRKGSSVKNNGCI